MICLNLTSLGLTEYALLVGAKMGELDVRGDLTSAQLEGIHRGMDVSINHMLEGGNGYPYNPFLDPSFEAGCNLERRDIRSLLLWQGSLEQCRFDRNRGVVQ